MSGPVRGASGPPQSPCVRICRLDDARLCCLGCGRTTDEIAAWWTMSDGEKRAVLQRLAARAKPVADPGDTARFPG